MFEYSFLDVLWVPGELSLISILPWAEFHSVPLCKFYGLLEKVSIWSQFHSLISVVFLSISKCLSNQSCCSAGKWYLDDLILIGGEFVTSGVFFAVSTSTSDSSSSSSSYSSSDSSDRWSCLGSIYDDGSCPVIWLECGMLMVVFIPAMRL